MTSRPRYTMLTSAVLSLFLLVGCNTPFSTSQGVGSANQSSSQTTTSSAITVGAQAPSFSLATLNGKGNMSLKQLLGSKPIIINAWASWCGPCQDEEPELVALQKQYAGKVTVIGVNMTAEDSVSGAKKFVSQYHMTYPVLLDSKGTFLTDYQLVGFPTTFLISPSGKIVAMHAGALTKSQMQSLFKQAAAQA